MHAHTCVYTHACKCYVSYTTHTYIYVYTHTQSMCSVRCVSCSGTHTFIYVFTYIHHTHRNTRFCVSCVYTHSTNMHVTMARACIDIHTLSYMRVCVCVKGVYVHVCETVLIPWRTNACLSPLQWCMEINRNIPCCLESFVPECVLFWDLTESSQTGWFPVWAARKTRELLELKITLGLMAWALTEPGKVLELRGGEHTAINIVLME